MTTTITEQEEALLEKFSDHLAADGASSQTRKSYISYVRTAMRTVDVFDPETADSPNHLAQQVVNGLKNRDLTDSTAKSYVRVVKRFWEWRTGNSPPDKLDEPKARTQTPVEELKSKIRKQEKIEQLIVNIPDIRVQGAVAIVLATAIKPKECLALRRGDVEITPDSLTVTVKKTEKTVQIDRHNSATPEKALDIIQRRVQMLDSAGVDADTSFWISIKSEAEDEGALGYQSVTYHLRKSSAEHSLEPPLTLTQVRQSRIANYISHNQPTGAEIAQKFDFTPDSPMPKRYLNVVEEVEFLSTNPVECPQCGSVIDGNRITCRMCHFPVGVVDDDCDSLADVSLSDVLEAISRVETRLEAGMGD